MERCVDGDRRAWDVLVRAHLPRLYRSLRRLLGTGANATEDIQDVLQVLFLKLWEDDRRRLRSFQGRSQLSTWLVAVARREALRYLERRKRAARVVPPPGNGASLPGRLGELVADPSRDLERAETVERVHDAVARLPLRDRLLVRLVCFDEASYSQAARALNVPVNSISPWLGRAKSRLASLLRDADEDSP